MNTRLSRLAHVASAALLSMASLAVLGQTAYSPVGQTPGKHRRPSIWWAPGDKRVMPAESTYPNELGTLAILNSAGPVDTRDHPFFKALGSNGRACVTCHQPADGMSLSAKTARERWMVTRGKDPLFAAIDGANCPNLPQEDERSHSLLLTKGLFRVAMPWPPRAADGTAIQPEFRIDVVSDPTGCNTSAQYGLNARLPAVSVFRRPRPVANLRYVEPIALMGQWQVRTGEVLDRHPETGARLQGNLMSDSRAPTLRSQMQDAMNVHLQMMGVAPRVVTDTLRSFELQLFAAQVSHRSGGSLQEGGAQLGPQAIAQGKTGVLAPFPHRPMFPELEGWRTQKTLAAMTWKPMLPMRALPEAREGEATETPAVRAYRDSVARGYDSFMYRPFLIRDVGTLNTALGNPLKQTCTNCHNMQHMAMDSAPGYLGLGTNNYPTATPSPDLPLFKLTCRDDAPPHPYLGRVIYAHDPGRALVTGKCGDIGAVTTQQMRVLAARAPYFAGGSARDLREVVEFYDRRFNIGYTQQEIEDLVNFMGAL